MVEMEKHLIEKDKEIQHLKDEIHRLKSNSTEIVERAGASNKGVHENVVATGSQVASVGETDNMKALSCEDDEVWHKCTLCEAKYKNFVSLRKHYTAKHKEVEKKDIPRIALSFPCKMCEKTFDEQRYLINHIKYVHEKPTCQFCGEAPSHLKRHEKVCE